MNKQLIFILVFIIIIPVAVINGFGYTYTHSENPSPEYFKYLAMVKIVTVYFLCVGGFFLITHLRALGSTTQKVSFINQVSHELKTPLTNLQLYIDLLKEDLSEEPSALKKVAVLEQESARLNRLVHNILMFSYGERLTLNKQDEDIDALVTNVVDGFRPLFGQNGTRIELDCNVGTASVDRTVLEQVLVNLISNVEKYAPDGEFLKIAARKAEGQTIITVQDDGPGIPDDMKQTIFQPFSRGDDRLTEGVSGIGIGLTLSVNLMDAHGGTLRLKDTDHGTCFEVIF